MRLTKGIKAAVVLHILEDVPQVNYMQQAEDLMRKFFTAKLPPKIAALAKSEHSDRLTDHYASVRLLEGSRSNRVTVCIRGGHDKDTLTEDERSQVLDILRLDCDQEEKINNLRHDLELSLAGLQTRAAFVGAFPEFEKYLPAEPDKILSTGLISTSVVTSLVEAGWPKGETS